MAFARPNQLIDTLSAPVGDLIAEVGRGVAEAQQAMDTRTIETVRALAEAAGPEDPLDLLRQVGYRPTWYQIPEATAEITVALTITGSGTSEGGAPSGGRRARLLAAPVDASYTNRYGYELKAASTVRFRVVPVPPSPAAERLRAAPSVVGLALAEARSRLEALDVPYRFADDNPHADGEKVVSQKPEAGGLVAGDDAVELGF